jgi:hypothetical protein
MLPGERDRPGCPVRRRAGQFPIRCTRRGRRAPQARCLRSSRQPCYNFFLPAALILAQRVLAIAESFFLAAGLILLFVFSAELFPLTFAQRALAAADIFALADALIFRLFSGMP